MDRIAVTPLASALGAEVAGVDLRNIDDESFERLREAWHRHLVLRFRGQELDVQGLLRFSRRFGELDPPGPNPYGAPFLAEHPEINVISNVVEGGRPIGNLGDGEASWHCDMTYVEAPPSAALWQALEIPPEGGDTYWANMYLAYETLPADLREAIAGRVAVHDASMNSAGLLRKGMRPVTDPREAPGARHPLVVVHPETRRLALFLGRRRNSYVVGLELERSEALLDRLWAHATQPDLLFRQVWKKGDLVLWDNRCTLHRRDAFDPASRRVMHRTQIRGRPVIAP
jgi:taurine dioxygenase